MRIKKLWTCPKCKTKNSYDVERTWNLFNEVIGKPSCKQCGLQRFSNEYYSLIKKKKEKKE